MVKKIGLDNSLAILPLVYLKHATSYTDRTDSPSQEQDSRGGVDCFSIARIRVRLFPWTRVAHMAEWSQAEVGMAEMVQLHMFRSMF